MIRHALLTTLLAASGAAAHAATWRVETAHSMIGFTGTQTGKPFTGHFAHYDAAIDFDPARPEAASLRVTIDPASATTGDRQRDTALPGHDWFDVAAFPQAVFESRTVRRTGPNAYVAEGTLTLRGVSRPVSLPFTLDIANGSAHAVGHLDLTRTLFGIGQGPWASGQWVGSNVAVAIDITAHADAPAGG